MYFFFAFLISNARHQRHHPIINDVSTYAEEFKTRYYSNLLSSMTEFFAFLSKVKFKLTKKANAISVNLLSTWL